ncbi:MAG TPA: DUF2167 domain-containing protein [Allosphingosinicella sp.]|jgi:uncharacterized membrane-anchored protein
MKHLTKLLLPLAAALLAVPAHAQAPTAEQAARIAKIEALAKDLHPATGDIRIAEAEAVLHLGKDYYFLPAAEARRVLVDAWGNPPEVATDVLGLVFPAGKTFLDDTWGAVVTFDRSGWVSDEDAQSTDYNALLGQMQEGEDELNERRTSEGYPAQHLVGWAQPPVYDPKTHSVVWAQNIQFTGQAENSLNYDVRLLGRRGVLSLNMLTGMSKLGETRDAAAKFASVGEFTSGARYADYKPGTDEKAEYGVAGLVAAGVGVAAAKKLGLLAIVLGFGKKFLILILAAFGGVGAWVKRRFTGGGNAEEEQSYGDEPAGWEEPQAAPDSGSPAGEVSLEKRPGD